MAGHSKFKNIQHRKGAQDKKRAKIFTKLVREIITATKLGGADPGSNPRLRNAISSARVHNLPKDRIDSAITKATEVGDSENYSEIRYEGFAVSGVAIIVEALTDNKNRTAAEVRSAFSKFGGNLGETGSVSFMFQRLGIINYPVAIATSDEILAAIIEIPVEDVETDEEFHYIYTDPVNFTYCLEYLNQKYGDPADSYIGWRPNNLCIIDDQEKAEKLLRLIESLEESDDVQRVFGNYTFSDKINI